MPPLSGGLWAGLGRTPIRKPQRQLYFAPCVTGTLRVLHPLAPLGELVAFLRGSTSTTARMVPWISSAVMRHDSFYSGARRQAKSMKRHRRRRTTHTKAAWSERARWVCRVDDRLEVVGDCRIQSFGHLLPPSPLWSNPAVIAQGRLIRSRGNPGLESKRRRLRSTSVRRSRGLAGQEPPSKLNALAHRGAPQEERQVVAEAAESSVGNVQHR